MIYSRECEILKGEKKERMAYRDLTDLKEVGCSGSNLTFDKCVSNLKISDCIEMDPPDDDYNNV